MIDFEKVLKKDFRVSNYYLNENYFSQTERRDSVWYGTAITLITLNLNHYTYSVMVTPCGEVRISNNKTGDYVKSCGYNDNVHNVCLFLEQNGINNDVELYKVQEEDIITIENNNWFEIVIENVSTGEFITDSLEDPLVNPEDVNIDYIIKLIEHLESSL